MSGGTTPRCLEGLRDNCPRDGPTAGDPGLPVRTLRGWGGQDLLGQGRPGDRDSRGHRAVCDLGQCQREAALRHAGENRPRDPRGRVGHPSRNAALRLGHRARLVLLPPRTGVDEDAENMVQEDAAAKNGIRGYTPVVWCAERLPECIRVVSPEELLWRIRMQHDPIKPTS